MTQFLVKPRDSFTFTFTSQFYIRC